jgi:hypothetical protein
LEPIYRTLAILFAGFFALNVYFRLRIFRHYRVLIDNRVEFGTAEIFSEAKMEKVIARHPDLKDAITKFCRNMRFTMWMATVFVILVIILWFVLLRHR